MARMPAIEVDIHTSVGLVRPGDKLVIAVSRPLDMATADRIKQRFEASLPGVEIVLVEATALVVYRPS